MTFGVARFLYTGAYASLFRFEVQKTVKSCTIVLGFYDNEEAICSVQLSGYDHLFMTLSFQSLSECIVELSVRIQTNVFEAFRVQRENSNVKS